MTVADGTTEVASSDGATGAALFALIGGTGEVTVSLDVGDLLAKPDLMVVTDGTTEVATIDGATGTALSALRGGTSEVAADDLATGSGLLAVAGATVEVARVGGEPKFGVAAATGGIIEEEELDGSTLEGFVPDAALDVFDSLFCCSITVDLGSALQQRNITASN